MKRRTFMIGATGVALAGCAQPSKFRRYNGPEITGIVVNKTDREMFLLHQGTAIKKYRVDLGFAPLGHKVVEGDGKTPEGVYLIDRRNPDSSFHLSLGISYPNARDIEAARALDQSPGGDIFIHGQPNGVYRVDDEDWTNGCIAVRNRQMEEIYAMVRIGTPIALNA